MGILSYLNGFSERSAERHVYRELLNNSRTMRDIGLTPGDVEQRLRDVSFFRS